MPRLIVTESAVQGLTRCRDFLGAKAPEGAQRAAQAIIKQFTRLETTPTIGRPLPEAPELRELIIRFGEAGYVALYRYMPDDESVYTLAFRHQKEAGF